MGRYLIAAATTAAIVALPYKMMAQTPALQTPGVRDYVSEVIRLNAAVQARRLNLGAATERIEPAGALPDPNVVAGVMSVPMPSFDFAAEAMTQLHLGLQQTFPFPGKRTAATELARADSDVSGADLNQLETDLSASATAAYFELAYARTAAAVWRARLGVADQAVVVAESRYGAGEVPQIDPLRARLELSRLEERLDQIEASILGAGARADALRGGRGEALAVILLVDANGGPAFRPSDETLPDLEDSIGRLERQNSAMLAARTRVGRAQRAVRVFDLAGRPDFFTSLQTGVRFGGREPFLTAQVGIPIPLWSSRKQTPATRAARLEADAVQLEYDDLLARLEWKLRAAHADLGATQLRVERTMTATLPLAEAASESALQRYRVGETDFNTVLETQDDLYATYLELARLLASYGIRRAELAALLGEEWYR